MTTITPGILIRVIALARLGGAKAELVGRANETALAENPGDPVSHG